MVTVGPKPQREAELGPAPSLGRVDDGAQQPAGAQPVHPSGPLAGVRRGFSVSRMVASHRPVSTGLRSGATGLPGFHHMPRGGAAPRDLRPVLTPGLERRAPMAEGPRAVAPGPGHGNRQTKLYGLVVNCWNEVVMKAPEEFTESRWVCTTQLLAGSWLHRLLRHREQLG